jgi:hypothetical protein
MNSKTIVERALEIAPLCGSIAEVRRQLIREGYRRVITDRGPQLRQEIACRLNPELKHRIPRIARETKARSGLIERISPNLAITSN